MTKALAVIIRNPGVLCSSGLCCAMSPCAMAPLVQVTRLLLEADEWDSSDVAVPHLTYFHPRQENDLGVRHTPCTPLGLPVQ